MDERDHKAMNDELKKEQPSIELQISDEQLDKIKSCEVLKINGMEFISRTKTTEMLIKFANEQLKEKEDQLTKSNEMNERLAADRKIVREAQRAFCMSAEFWSRIKEGKIPYTFDKNKNKLEELGYSDTMASLKGQYRGGSDVYWLTDAEYPEVNETLQNIAGIDTMKRSYQQQIEKFKK